MINKHFLGIFANLVQSLHANGLNERLKSTIQIAYRLPIFNFLLAGLLLFYLFLSAHAQNFITNAGNAIREGDAKALSVCFDQRLNLTFSDKTTTCSRRQAEMTIQKFFSKVEPTNFINPEQGLSNHNNTTFLVGNMTRAMGSTRSIFCLSRKKGIISSANWALKSNSTMLLHFLLP